MSITHTTHARNGFALPVAVFALVVVGVLVTGGFFMARQETRIGVASQNAQTAFYLAERGVYDVLSDWRSAYSTAGAWTPVTVDSTMSDGSWSVTITPMTNRLFFLDATGTAAAGGAMYGGATRRVGMIARINTADIMPPAGLTTQGLLRFGGSAEIHGTDTAPDGSGGEADWSGLCTNSTGDKPGILIDDTTNIDWNGNRDKIEGNSSGDPMFTEDPTITTESLTTFGDLTWDDMVGLADKTIYSAPAIGPSLNDDGTCDTSPLGNWGAPMDPAHACFNYFPIIYSAGDLHLSGGVGQGILLVDGDLKVTGGTEFYGPVWVKGTLSTQGAGGHFWGGVVAANVDINVDNTESVVLGNAVINFSSCSVERAILNNSALTKARPLASRSWVDLSSVTYE